MEKYKFSGNNFIDGSSMSSAGFDPSYGWHEIREHTLTLRGRGPENGIAASSITFVARSVLSRPDSIHSPDAIAFDITIAIAHSYADEPVQHRRVHGDYSILLDQRGDLAALRAGSVKEVKLSMEGLALHIYHHEWGVRSGLCVEGVASSVMDVKWWPWAKRGRKMGDWLLDDNSSAYCLQFAFLTSMIDPPHIEHFIRDIDALTTHLQQFKNS